MHNLDQSMKTDWDITGIMVYHFVSGQLPTVLVLVLISGFIPWKWP